MKNKIFKILAGILAIILICVILFITNAFVGNPISAKLAENAVKNYVNEKYPHLDLKLEKPVYNFKDGNYIVWAKSKTSIDTRFNINYRNGEVYYDNYEFYVLDMHNTLDRLADEYTFVVRKILERELGYKDNATRVMYDKGKYENAKDILKLDMEFDRTLPLNPEVNISIKDIKDISLENMSKILTDAHKVFVENECYFKKYGLDIGDSEIVIMVSGIIPEDIEGGQLLDLLQQAMDNKDDIIFEKDGDKVEHDDRITIFVKTK